MSTVFNRSYSRCDVTYCFIDDKKYSLVLYEAIFSLFCSYLYQELFKIWKDRVLDIVTALFSTFIQIMLPHNSLQLFRADQKSDRNACTDVFNSVLIWTADQLQPSMCPRWLLLPAVPICTFGRCVIQPQMGSWLPLSVNAPVDTGDMLQMTQPSSGSTHPRSWTLDAEDGRWSSACRLCGRD